MSFLDFTEPNLVNQMGKKQVPLEYKSTNIEDRQSVARQRKKTIWRNRKKIID